MTYRTAPEIPSIDGVHLDSHIRDLEVARVSLTDILLGLWFKKPTTREQVGRVRSDLRRDICLPRGPVLDSFTKHLEDFTVGYSIATPETLSQIEQYDIMECGECNKNGQCPYQRRKEKMVQRMRENQLVGIKRHR